MAMRGKESENGVYEFPYMKPPQRSAWESFRTGCYDSKNGTVLGRNGKSWAQILFFYLIFYAVLAALFSICMKGLLSTIDEREPKWKMDSSLIGNNPGLGFRPISNRTEEGSLIWFNSRNATSIQKWVGFTEDFMQPYREASTGKNRVICDFDKMPTGDQVCHVDLDKFGACGPKNHYGFNSSSPCIFLKLNRIFDWVPDYYDDPNNLPENMPQQLKDKIVGLPPSQRKQVWVSCIGEHPADKEHVSQFEYLPSQGFPSYYYPYRNAPGYLSPIVAVQIRQPTPNVLINIECRSWAKNINYRGGNQREGSVRFEIMRDI